MPLKKAWRTLTMGAELAAFLWRRYNPPHGSGPAATQPTEVDPAPRESPVAIADDVTENGRPAGTQTIRFGLDGQEYEIDLGDENAAELREAFRRYIDAGRRMGRQPTTPLTARPAQRPAERTTADSHDTATIRKWARTHGYQISDRGPIPGPVRQAYDATRRPRRRSS